MPRETTYTGMLGDWLRLFQALLANAVEVPALEGLRVRLGELLNRAQELIKEQSALKTRKQETSRELKEVSDEGQRLVTTLRSALKQHYGPLWPLTPIRRNLNHLVDRQRHPARSAAGGGAGEGWGMLCRAAER